MRKQWIAVLVVCVPVGALAAVALSSSPPVGALPPGPVKTLKRPAGSTFAVTLPAPGVAGRVWRVARGYDSAIVRELDEATTTSGVRVRFRAVAPGTTKIVYAQTRGETSRAYASRTFEVVVTKDGCPTGLLALTANPIGPAVTAALVGDSAGNRPQAVGASIASRDAQRGPQVRARCGTGVWRRTVVVYITDRALLPSQSASQRVLFVGRTSAGYRVWQRAH